MLLQARCRETGQYSYVTTVPADRGSAGDLGDLEDVTGQPHTAPPLSLIT